MEPENNESLEVTLLGTPSFHWRGEALKLPSAKSLPLLCYLAAEARPIPRPKLAELLWHSGRLVNLRQEIAKLRKLPGARSWLIVGDALQLKARTDLEALQQAIHSEDYAEGLAIWHRHRSSSRKAEHFLSTLKGSSYSEPFQLWLDNEREYLHTLYSDLLFTSATEIESLGDIEQALELYRELLEQDGLNETAHQAVMRLEIQRGNPKAALRQFEKCRQSITREAGVEPLETTLALAKEIEESVSKQRTEVSESLKSLPRPPTAFVGRQREIREITTLLTKPDCRLLTLLGPGGIGKTRLALQVAKQRVGDFANGVYFISFASVSHETLIPSIIANAIGLDFSGEKDLKDKLLAHLRYKTMLLVMDNFEYVIDSAGILNEILDISRYTKFIVTSREHLDLQSEHLYEVGGMSYPESADAEGFLDFDAIRLFWQSTRRLKPKFVLGTAEEPHILRICRLVRGMPLAIELAATWVRALSCESIAEEIEKGSLDLLATTLKDIPERHRNIRAVFEKSWQMLRGDEKKITPKLSVFPGGFTREAAKEIANASLHNLLGLINKTFLYQIKPDRFGMHELVRAFAEEKLGLARDRTHKRMVDYFVQFVQENENNFAVLQEEQENILASLETASVQNTGNDYLDKVNVFFPFLDLKGLYSLARMHLTKASQVWQIGNDPAKIVKTLLNLGSTYKRLGLPIKAIASFERALAHSQASGDSKGEASSLGSLGNVYQQLGEYDKALEHGQKGLIIFRRLGARSNEARQLDRIAILYQRKGDMPRAIENHRKAITIFREMGLRIDESTTLDNLGHAYLRLDQTDKALECYQKAHQISSEIGFRRGEAGSLCSMASVFYWKGESSQALDHYQRALAIFRELGIRFGEGLCLANLGNVHFDLGNYPLVLDYHQQALMIAREIGDRVSECAGLGGLGATHLKLNELSKAKDYFQEALAISRKIENPREEINHLENLATVYRESENYSESLVLYQQALHIARRLGSRIAEGSCLSNLAIAYDKLGHKKKAIATVVAGHLILKALESPWWKTFLPTLRSLSEEQAVFKLTLNNLSETGDAILSDITGLPYTLFHDTPKDFTEHLMKVLDEK